MGWGTLFLPSLLEDLREKKVHFGLFVKDVADIYGIVTWYDRSYYEGGFRNGIRHGAGRFLIPSKDYKYEGEFNEGNRCGKGQEIISQVNIYEGDFSRNLKEGVGTLVTPEYHYHGEFKKNKFNGFGTCKWRDKRQYEGHWEAGHFHGEGTFSWPDGRRFCGKLTNDHRDL